MLIDIKEKKEIRELQDLINNSKIINKFDKIIIEEDEDGKMSYNLKENPQFNYLCFNILNEELREELLEDISPFNKALTKLLDVEMQRANLCGDKIHTDSFKSNYNISSKFENESLIKLNIEKPKCPTCLVLVRGTSSEELTENNTVAFELANTKTMSSWGNSPVYTDMIVDLYEVVIENLEYIKKYHKEPNKLIFDSPKSFLKKEGSKAIKQIVVLSEDKKKFYIPNIVLYQILSFINQLDEELITGESVEV